VIRSQNLRTLNGLVSIAFVWGGASALGSSSQQAKYAGGGAFAVGGVAAAHYLYRPDLGPEPEVTTTTRTETGLPSTTQPLPELRVSCVPDENASWQDLVFLDGQVFEQVTARAFW